MFKGTGCRNFGSPRATKSWRGRFIDGVWHCDCEPRLPADRFQTKNGGVNHGRWFYTCQQPQDKRCKFFLWEDQAKTREKFAVLSKSRSEPDTPNKTPAKAVQSRGGLLTPATGSRQCDDVREGEVERTPSKRRRGQDLPVDEDSFDWDDDLDEEVQQLLSRPLKQPDFGLETPRKAPRTATITSPGKRKLMDTEHDSPTKYPVSIHSTIELCSTPRSHSASQVGGVPPSSVEISTTPTPRRYTNMLSAHSSAEISTLAAETLSLLDRHDVVLPTKAKDELVALLNRHDLKTQGIIRGREVTRLALKEKDEQIRELNERIEGLEAEREMERAVIAGLKTENDS
ncbi:hypothetical protein VTN77DRAFT_1070 [Rasamsonia byssochlamydoides]|uniref:uncharacterized protein n=1 Tax=Rasamsonia byssochlamydoides TaxID=89139 RepID=UPI0037434075